MVTPDLTIKAGPPHRSLPEQLAAAYTAGWTLLLAVAAACALTPAARSLAHRELALALHVHIRPAPHASLREAASLLVENLRATAWPLILCLLGAQHHDRARRIAHAAVIASLAANLLPVAAAIGVYRAQLVPYLPHLPFELYATTTGPATWLLHSRRAIDRPRCVVVALSILVALAAAAALETWAVPHQ